MKTIILLIAIVFFFSCTKQHNQGYRIYNLGSDLLTISTDENTYQIESTKSVFFITQGEPRYYFENPDLKVRIVDLRTSPDKHFNICSYQYDFKVRVEGCADSVEILINGQYFKDKLPFEFGTNERLKSYQIYSIPKYSYGDVWTTVFASGRPIERVRHIDGNPENLTGNVTYLESKFNN